MELTSLTAISPIDGRYRGKCENLDEYFSEYALIRYRVRVEIEYFIALCELPLPQLSGVSADLFEPLRDIYRNFSVADAKRIKDIESVTNHDVKAVEYFITLEEAMARVKQVTGQQHITTEEQMLQATEDFVEPEYHIPIYILRKFNIDE